MQHHHCKMCRSPLHADDTHAECVSCLGKCHADAALSGTDCSHCESFSLASLHTRIAFFSESDSTPRTLPFSSCQGLVRKKQWGRGFERPVISELTSTQCPRASPSPQREHSPVLFTQHDQPPSPKDSHTRTGYEHLPPLDESMAAHLCPPTDWRQGESSVQAVQSHICTCWTCLLGGWTSGFGATLYGCAPGLPRQDAHHWGSRSRCSFTQGPEERDTPGSTRHQSHCPSHWAFDVQPDGFRAPPLAHDDGDERGGQSSLPRCSGFVRQPVWPSCGGLCEMLHRGSEVVSSDATLPP